MSEFNVGDKAILKVGRNVVTVEILRPMGDGKAYWVKKHRQRQGVHDAQRTAQSSNGQC